MQDLPGAEVLMTTKRAAYYARVSTDLQIDNTSLPEQREICEAAIRSGAGN